MDSSSSNDGETPNERIDTHAILKAKAKAEGRTITQLMRQIAESL